MKKLLAILVFIGLAGYAYASTPMTPQQGEDNQLHALQDDYNQRQAQATTDYINQHDQEHPDGDEVTVKAKNDDDSREIKVSNNDVLVSNETR